jgi:peptidoglycan/xylan/chitin deacetylase (PgdA/CDA1 family)/phage tail protein X
MRRLLFTLALLAGCSQAPVAPPAAPAPAASPAQPAPERLWPAAARQAPRPGAEGRVAGAHDELLVMLPAPGDRFDAIAERFLGSASLAWHVAQANPGLAAPAPGLPLRVPLQAPSPLGVTAAGAQAVTVLCYHRFGPGADPGRSRMVMPIERFEAQLNWLLREGWTVLRLADFEAFLAGRQALPPRSVLITVDDGWESFHRHAFPLLRRLQLPATLFVTTDLVGTREGLSWAQLRELAQSGLVDIQAHGRTHRDLTQPLAGETDTAWRRALRDELRQPRLLLERQLADAGVRVRQFAYPYGAVNDAVLDALNAEPYTLAYTVRAGSNPFYAAPRQLRRTMIFGDHTLEDFIARLQPLRSVERP